jgi:hypothetical protein
MLRRCTLPCCSITPQPCRGRYLQLIEGGLRVCGTLSQLKVLDTIFEPLNVPLLGDVALLVEPLDSHFTPLELRFRGLVFLVKLTLHLGLQLELRRILFSLHDVHGDLYVIYRELHLSHGLDKLLPLALLASDGCTGFVELRPETLLLFDLFGQTIPEDTELQRKLRLLLGGGMYVREEDGHFEIRLRMPRDWMPLSISL